jgi:hypothetical protein
MKNRDAMISLLDQFNWINDLQGWFRPHVCFANNLATFGFSVGPSMTVYDLVAGATKKLTEKFHSFNCFHECMNRFGIPTRPTNIFTANYESEIGSGRALVYEKLIMDQQRYENLIDYYDRLKMENHKLQNLILLEATEPILIQDELDEIPEEIASQNNLKFFKSLE